MNIFGVVYVAFNQTNGKCYVGQTTQEPFVRFEQHRRRSSSHCRALSNAIKFYGQSAFQFFIVCAALSRDALNEAEVAMIAAYDSAAPGGYNIKAGGAAGRHSAETRAKIGAAHKGRTKTLEQVEKYRLARLGKSPSRATRDKIAASLRGRPIAPDNLAKLIAANTGRIPSQEAKLKMSRNRSGIPVSAMTKEKLRAANLGKKHAGLTREKMSASQRERWARRLASAC